MQGNNKLSCGCNSDIIGCSEEDIYPDSSVYIIDIDRTLNAATLSNKSDVCTTLNTPNISATFTDPTSVPRKYNELVFPDNLIQPYSNFYVDGISNNILNFEFTDIYCVYGY